MADKKKMAPGNEADLDSKILFRHFTKCRNATCTWCVCVVEDSSINFQHQADLDFMERR